MANKQRVSAKNSGSSQSNNELPGFQEILDAAQQFFQAGRLADAETLYRQILTLDPLHDHGLYMLGIISYRLGRLDTAAGLIVQAIGVRGDAFYYNSLGNVLTDQGKRTEAAAHYREALTLKPDFAEACNNLGNSLKSQGKVDDAILFYERAIALKPAYAEAHNNLGAAYMEKGRLDDAVACYERAIALKPDSAEFYSNLGALRIEQGRLDDSILLCEKAIALKPDFVLAHNNLGNSLKSQGKVDDAIPSYERAIVLKPAYAEAHNNLGAAYMEKGWLDDAVACFERAIALKPDYAEACNNLGNGLKSQGKVDDAILFYERAIVLKPAYAEAHNNLGVAYMEKGRLDDAVACFERAIALKPDYAELHMNNGYARLLKGDFAAGWPEHEWRWRTKAFEPYCLEAPLWDGRDLKGKTILLHCEQGLGDNIQFIRYAALVKRKGGRVLLLCEPALVSLFKSAVGVDQIITDPNSLPPHVCRASLLSLPGILNVFPDRIPATIPYLHVSPALKRLWDPLLAPMPGFRIGIVWRGNPNHKKDGTRSMTPAQFAGFLNFPGLSVVSLQKDGTEAEIEALGLQGPILNARPNLRDFSDTAALVSALDLVITVDTAVCHLAGALGVPVWTLVPFAPDWRWQLGRTDSVWYPTMRLFRQIAPGNWSTVIGGVHDALRAEMLGRLK